MDLSNALTTVTPTLDAAVLRGLASADDWKTCARVHRRADAGTSEGVRKVLARLVAQGIVERRQGTRPPQYRLNADHVAHDGIVRLLAVRMTIIERIVRDLQSWTSGPAHASLTGPFARHEAGPDDVIDVLAVFAHAPADEHERALRAARAAQLEAAVLRWTGNRAVVVALDHAELAAQIADGRFSTLQWRENHEHLHGVRLLTPARELFAVDDES